MSQDIGLVALIVFIFQAVAGIPTENIVYPKIIQSRDLNGEKTLHIRRGLVLRLEKSRVFSENFVFSEDDGVNRLDRLINGTDLGKKFYQDRNHTSVLFIDEENGTVQVRGIVSKKFSIEPISLIRRSEDELIPHKLSELQDFKNQLGDASVEDLIHSRWDDGQASSEVTERKVNKLPEKFVVEVRIFTDPARSKNSTMDDLIEYFGLIMNRVNQFYEELTEPRVEFIVLGITKLMDDSMANIISDPQRNKTLINICGTLDPFHKYVKATLAQDSQDAVLYVSSLKTGRTDKKGKIIGGVDGCAYPCGVCSGNTVTVQSLQRRQPGNWEPYLVAHELGHLIGMRHEGDKPYYSTPGNKGLRCGKKDGYILGSAQAGPSFSRCTRDQMKGCLMTKEQRCFELTGGSKVI